MGSKNIESRRVRARFAVVLWAALAMASGMLQSPSRADAVSTRWSALYSGNGGGTGAHTLAVAVDGTGDVAATGEAPTPESSDPEIGDPLADVYTARYAGDTGTLRWQVRTPERRGTAIHADAQGNVFVVSHSYVLGEPFVYYLTKHAADDGDVLWEITLAGAAAVTGDASGNVCVAGTDSHATAPIFIARYNGSNGTQIWFKRRAPPAGSNAAVSGVKADAGGNVYVSGGGTTSLYTSATIFTAKYAAADGAIVFGRNYTADDVAAPALDVSAAGEAAITTTRRTSTLAEPYAYGFYTAKYAANGVTLWEQTFAPDNGFGQLSTVALDGPGNVFSTGFIGRNGTPTGRDLFVCKRAAATGALLWSVRSVVGSGSAVVADANGDAIVTGNSPNYAFGPGYITKLSGADGATLWSVSLEANGRFGGGGPVLRSNGDVAVGRTVVNGASISESFVTVYQSSTTPRYGDLLIKDAEQDDAALSADDIYVPTAVGRQLRQYSFEAEVGAVAEFDVVIENDADEEKTFRLMGSDSGDTGWKVEALQGAADRWPAMMAAGFVTGVMQPGATLRFKVRLSDDNPSEALPNGTKHAFEILAVDDADPAVTQDAVGAEVETVTALVVNTTGDEPDADPDDGVADVDTDEPGQQVTLRAAIQFANAREGKDIIRFEIPGDDPNIIAGVPRIEPATPLPEIIDAIKLDGWSQNPSAATPPIELSGDTVNADTPNLPPQGINHPNTLLSPDGLTSGLVVQAGDCEIRGLAINHFGLAGMEIHGPGCTVQGVFFGTNPAGTLPKANGTGAASGVFGNYNLSGRTLRGCGLAITSANNLIGGSGAQARNLFSGNGGVLFDGAETNYFIVAENFSQRADGVYRSDLVRIGGASAPGIIIQGPLASGNRVEGNHFGLDVTGLNALTPIVGPDPQSIHLHAAAGVLINRASNNTIGSATAGGANYFVNQIVSVLVTGESTGNRVIGNVVGLNVNHVLPVGTKGDTGGSIDVVETPGRNDIGGYAPGEGNLLCNGEPSLIYVIASVDTVVAGNQIGQAPPGVGGADDGMKIGGLGAVVENNTIAQCATNGIVLSGTEVLVRHNTIVGLSAYNADVSNGAGIWAFGGPGKNRIYDNEVSHHGQRGMLIETSNNEIIGNHVHDNFISGIVLRGGRLAFDTQPIENKIWQNRIYGNGALAISFGDGKKPTPNVEFRIESGPNRLRNSPVIGVFPDHCRLNGNTLTVVGTLTSTASTTFRVEFFASPRATRSGRGEGERYIGAQNVTTNFTGIGNFTFTAANVAQIGEYISATATDPAGNTSEFSDARSVHGESFTFSNKGLSDEEQQGVPSRPPLAPREGSLALGAGMGDGNGDGTPDFQQANVASLIGIAGEWITLEAPAGVALENVAPCGPPEFDQLPRGYTFPAGFLSFKATGVEAGKSVAIREIFHSTFAFSTVFAYGPTPDKPQPHWYEFIFDGKTGGEIVGDEIAFTFIDGKRGDHDLQANGALTTILAPAYLPPTPAAAMSAGQVTGEPADTKFASFAPPQSGPFAGTMLVGKKKVAAIFAADGRVRAKVGGNMPGLSGVTFAKLGPPSGDAALATLAGDGIDSSNNDVLLAGLRDGPVRIAAGEGQATNLSGVSVKKFGTIDGNGAAIFFLATLQGSGVTPKNSAAFCSAPGDDSIQVLVRKNDPVGDKFVGTIATLVGVAGTLAEGRWRVNDYAAGVRLTFTDKSSAIYAIPALPGDDAPWTLWAGTGPGATASDPVLTGLGFPGFGSAGPAFLAKYKPGVGGILASNDTFLFRGDSEADYPLLAREGADAPHIAVPPGAPAATFKKIADPVSGPEGRTAFLSTLAGVKANVATCLYYSPAAGDEFPLARAGDPAPGGGKFASFVSLAFPDGANSGPLFTAKLANDKAAGIGAANNFGLWTADASGTLALVLRTGQSLNIGGTTRFVKKFTTLAPPPGSIGTAHGYDNAGHVSALVTFTDRTVALLEFPLP